jgi:outer membrane receptor protein involved in Fe transport
VTAAFVGAAGIVAIGLAMPVHAQSARVSPVSLEHRSARLTRGSISGTVSDERGGPLSGAMISALSGVTSATAVTDPRGRFLLELPAGEYIVRAHMTGFAASPRQVVRVSGLPSEHRFELRKLDLPVATTGTPVSARPIVAAGFDLPRPPASGPDADATDEKHPHNEMSWRLRHIKRGILKDASPAIVVADNETTIGSPSLFGRATDSVAMLASSLFSDFPFRGEVNFLTTSALAPGQMLFSEAGLPRGVAYLSLGAPAPGGEWTIRAAMSQGDLSSWIVAGAFDSREVGAHTYNLGLTYSTQEYQGGNPAALAAVTDGSRNVGELYAFDRWAAARRITLEYGARYAHYDYLENRGLLSPRVGVTLEPFERTRVRATVAQRMVAPGAEEFLSPVAPGPWLPPERTFAPLGGPGDLDVFRIERARSLDLALEHEFPSTYLIGVRRFYQNVDDQLVTLFGLNVPGGPESVGHYYVASAGAVDAQGWALRLRSATTLPIRGTIDYSVTRARWLSRGDMAAVAPLAPAAIRPATEDLHDLTTSFETEIAETATRVFVLYKINTGYTRANTDLIRPGLDARFDVQVNQGLPLSVAGTKWEILVGVRNLFRDPNDPGSVYDELLVVRPPKRVVGGFLVRF